MPPHFFGPCPKKREWRPKEKRLLYGLRAPIGDDASHPPLPRTPYAYMTFGRGRLAALKYTALAVLGNEGNKVAAARRAASIKNID